MLVVSHDITEREQAEERATRLACITAALAHATSSREIAQIIIEQGILAFGAAAGSIVLLDNGGETFRIIAATGYTEEVLAKWKSFSSKMPVPLAEATRAGHALYFESNQEFASKYPALSGDQSARFGARAVLPLTIGGRLIACIGLSYVTPRRFDADERCFMETLAQHCGQAFERARLNEAAQDARAAAERAADRIARLYKVASELVLALTPAQTARVIAREAVAALGAFEISVKLLSKDGAWLEDVERVGNFSATTRELFRRYRISTALPQADAVRTGAALWFGTRQELFDRYPHLKQAALEFIQATCAIPLRVGERTLGGISISFAEAFAFTAERREFILSLADQCALAMERARLYQVEQLARVELEARIRERTQELAEANQARKELLRQLVTGQEEERRRVARELHDQLRQLLTVLDLELEALRVDGRTDSALQPRIERVQQLGKLTSDAVQGLVYDLRPSALDYLGLESTLRHDLGEWSKRHHIPARFASTGITRRLDPLIEITLYRIAQEALDNIVKHANAQRVSLTLEQRDGRLTMMIEDDGRGFEYKSALNGTTARGKLGLINMRERAEMFGGALEIESAPDGGGTTVFVSISLERAAI